MFHLNPIRLKHEKKGAKCWREIWVKVNNCFHADKRGLKLRKEYISRVLRILYCLWCRRGPSWVLKLLEYCMNKIVWLKRVNEFSFGAKLNIQWRGSRSRRSNGRRVGEQRLRESREFGLMLLTFYQGQS